MAFCSSSALFVSFSWAADFGSHLLGFGQVLVELRLRLPTFSVSVYHLCDSLTGSLEMLFLQTLQYAVRLLGNQFQCKHSLYNLFYFCLFGEQSYKKYLKVSIENLL